MGESLRADFEIGLPRFRLAPNFGLGPELAVLFGPSGAGKTLTLKSLAGLVRPDRGSIQLSGRVLFDSDQGIDLRPQARRIGYVPQHYALFPHRSIAQNIEYGLHELSSTERRNQVTEMLSLMRLEDLADRRPGEVSSGQQQRAALARAVARQPDLLLMDEPFAAVEEDLRAHLRAELVRVQGETQIPVLLVTHSLTEAYSLAQRLVVLYRGEVMQHGARDEVYRRPSTPEVARLMGMSNILSVNVAGQDRGQLSVDWNGVRLAIAHDGVQPSGPSLVLGVRPEEISFVGPNDIEDLPNRLTGLVEREKEFGADHLLEVQVNSGRLEVRVTHPFYVATALGVGQSRALTIDPNRFHIFPKRG